MSQAIKRTPKKERPARGTEPNAESRAAIEELESGTGKRCRDRRGADGKSSMRTIERSPSRRDKCGKPKTIDQ